MTRRLALAGMLALGCAPSQDDSDGGGTTVAADGVDDGSGSGADESTGAELPLAEIRTSMGNILLRLRPDVAPATVDNFVAYIDSGFYDGGDGLGATIIHRTVPGFVIQMGGLTADLSAKSTMPAIASEAGGLSNDKGTVAMALAAGDADSATSQFFINVTDNPELDVDPPFTVFATVELGMDLIETISLVNTTDMPPYEDVPVGPITLDMVSVL